MGLGDVQASSIPKVCLVSPPRNGGSLTTRTFIPHRVHTAIGALGAVSVAVAARTSGTGIATCVKEDGRMRLEHPSGTLELAVQLAGDGPGTTLERSSLVRTARKLADGLVWPRGQAE